MDRRKFSSRLAVTLGTFPLTRIGQAQTKLWRVGMLETTSPALNAANLEAFRQRLRELGYTEGRNLVIEYRSSDGRAERFAALAREFVASKVDVIVVRGTPAAMAAKNATDSIPVVITATGEPLLFASSLSHPGGNVTGTSSVTADLDAKRLGLLRELLPNMSRIAALHNMDNATSPRAWREDQAAARALGIQVELLEARNPEDLEAAFMAASRRRFDGMVVGNDGIFEANRKLIADLAAKHRVPTMYGSAKLVDAGGLIAYGPIYSDLYRQAANLVAKIFAGAKAGDLPFEEPARFELVINAGAARALGLTIPQSLLMRADQVIQ